MDKESKTFSRLCGCGKAYKHESSFFRHIRKKHNGIYPLGTIKLAKGRPATKPKNRRC